MTTYSTTDDQATGWLQRAVDSAREIIHRAEAEDRDLTEAERAEHDQLVQRATTLREQIQRNRTVQQGMTESRVGSMIAGIHDSGTERREEFGSDARLNAAPQLYLTRDQINELHGGYLSRSVTSVTAPQAEIGQLSAATHPIMRDRFRVLDLIPTEDVSSELANPPGQYHRQTVAASNAKAVGEGGAKPESDPAYAPVPLVYTKIAHFIRASEEALTDGRDFRRMIETEGMVGLLEQENWQLLSGDNAAVPATGGTNMRGLLNQSGILTYAPGAAEPRILSLAKAQAQLQAGASFTNPNAVILNPADALLVRTFQSTANEFAAGFALGGDALSPSVWGMAMYITTRIAAGTALLGNFAEAATAYVRMPPLVKIDPFSESTSNLVKFIFEERIALAVHHPTALLALTFNGTT
jgi:HK97 family phage major capsid protein